MPEHRIISGTINRKLHVKGYCMSPIQAPNAPFVVAFLIFNTRFLKQQIFLKPFVTLKMVYHYHSRENHVVWHMARWAAFAGWRYAIWALSWAANCTGFYWYPYSFPANWNGRRFMASNCQEWLNTYTFPTEFAILKTKLMQIKSPNFCARTAKIGTTTPL